MIRIKEQRPPREGGLVVEIPPTDLIARRQLHALNEKTFTLFAVSAASLVGALAGTINEMAQGHFVKAIAIGLCAGEISTLFGAWGFHTRQIRNEWKQGRERYENNKEFYNSPH